jgi:hypothetical protein
MARLVMVCTWRNSYRVLSYGCVLNPVWLITEVDTGALILGYLSGTFWSDFPKTEIFKLGFSKQISDTQCAT